MNEENGIYLVIIIAVIILLGWGYSHYRELYNTPLPTRSSKRKVKYNSKSSVYEKLFIDEYNVYIDLLNNIDYYEKSISAMSKKIKGCYFFDKELYYALKKRREEYKGKHINYLNRLKSFSITNMFVPIGSDQYNIFIKMYFPNNANSNFFLHEFFNRKYHYIEYNGAYIVFYEEMIFHINTEKNTLRCYRYDEVNLDYYDSFVKRVSVKKNEEIIGETWLHARKDGSPDRRYSQNYRMYKVLKVKVYMMNYETDLAFYNKKDLQEFKSFITSIKRLEKNYRHDTESNRNSNSDKIATNIKEENIIYQTTLFDVDIEKTIDEVDTSSLIIDVEPISETTSMVSDFIENIISEQKCIEWCFHDVFGLGQVQNNEKEILTIEFLGGTTRKIAQTYAGLKHVKSSVGNSCIIKTEKYGYGVIIENREDGVIIAEFKDKKHVISGPNSSYEIIDVATLSESTKVPNEQIISEAEAKEEVKESKQVTIGTLVTQMKYGKGVIYKIEDASYTIVFDSGIEKKVSKSSCSVLEYFDKEKYDSKLEKLKRFDYVSMKNIGYGIIVDFNSDTITIAWKNKTVEKYNILVTCLLTRVVSERKIELLNLSIGDYLYSKKYGYGRIVEFIVDKIKLKFYDVPKEILVGMEYLQIPSLQQLEQFKSELRQSSLSRDLTFFTRLDKKYYSYKEALDIYTEYFSSKKSKEKSMVISTYKKAGFNLVKDFFVYCGYLKLEDCIYEEIISTKIYKYDYSIESDTYNYILDKMCKSYYCLKYDDGVYFTFSKYGEFGFNFYELLSFIGKLLDFIKEHKFVSIVYLKNNYEGYLPDEGLLLAIINSISMIKSRKMGNSYIYHLKDGQTVKKDLMYKFIVEEFNCINSKSCDIYDFMEHLNIKYEFEFEYSTFVLLLNELEDTNIYYSEDTEKIYSTKEEFYLEVYGNGNEENNSN